MGTKDNKIYKGGNIQPDNRRVINHSDLYSINESKRIPTRIEETNVTQKPPKPRGN